MKTKKSRRTSPIWFHFDLINKGAQAKCHYCSREINVRCWNTSNLFKHMKLNHPSVTINRTEVFSCDDQQEVSCRSDNVHSECKSTGSVSQNEPPSTVDVDRHDLTDIVGVIQSIDIDKTQEINDQLLKMIVKGLYPLSMIENPEFIKFVKMLNPVYRVPTRKILARSLLQSNCDDEETSANAEI